jgi:hypothetical protein
VSPPFPSGDSLFLSTDYQGVETDRDKGSLIKLELAHPAFSPVTPRGLSDDAHASPVTFKNGVIGQKRERLHNALRDQQAVKRVSMNERELGNARRVRGGYWQLDEVHVGKR